MTDVAATPTEAEMINIRNMFSKAADAIVSASELGKRVTELEHEQRRQKDEIESLKASNSWLNDQLNSVRQQRDQLQTQLEQERHAKEVLSRDLANANGVIEHNNARITELSDSLHRSQRESDDHLLRAMTAEEELEKVKAKLDEAFEWMDAAKALFRRDEPKEVKEPIPFPTVAVEPTVPADVPSPVHVDGTPTQEPEKVATGTDPYRW